MNPYPLSTLLATAATFALSLLCLGCKDDTHFADQVKAAATAQQWQAWALTVLERAKTNSVPPFSSEWPEFVQRVEAPASQWQLVLGRNGSSSNISLVSLGGFCSFGIDIGGPTFVEPPNPNQHHTRVYPGVYVVSN